MPWTVLLKGVWNSLVLEFLCIRPRNGYCMDSERNLLHYRRGQLHCEDGPAKVTENGTCYWYWQGRLHRRNGPAIEYPNNTGEWWNDGIHIRDGRIVYKTPAVPYLNWAKEGF